MTLYRRVDGNGRPLVLLHAGGLDSRMFHGDVPALARSNRVLAYDRAGSGRSAPSDGPVDRVSELHAVATRVFGTRPLLLVGSSYGGQLAVDFALAYPKLVAGLLLIAPGLSGATASRQRLARVSALRAAAHRGADELARAWFSDPHLAPHGFPPAIHDAVKTMLRENASVWKSAGAQAEAAPSVLPRLHRLHQPGLVVVGEYDDEDNQHDAEQLTRGARTISLCRIPRAGHYPQLECPGLLAKFVDTLLERLGSE